MKEHFQHNLSAHWRETLGFALFLAWVYCALFGCGLATVDESAAGMPSNYYLEYTWMASGLFEAVGAALGIFAVGKLPALAHRIGSGKMAATAAALAAAGNVVIWIAWYDRTLFDRLFLVGGGLMGLAVALFTVVWAARLHSLNEARLEFVIPCAFSISFLLYFVILLTKQSGLVVLALLVAMNIASAWLSSRSFDPEKGGKVIADAQPRGDWGLRSFTVVSFASWAQIAFFRVVSTPEFAGNRFTHYLIPFSLACMLSLIVLFLCIRMSRYLNVTLAYRWSLPLFMVSYVPIMIDYGNAELRILAYSINFLGMFGVQFGCWLGACKYIRRRGYGSLGVFGRYAMGTGAGIFAGCLLGLYAVKSLDTQGILTVSLVIMSLVVFVDMAMGFNPDWVFHRSASSRRSAAAPEGRPDASEPASLDAIFQSEATALQGRYGLTERETDVAALLLAGRSRPFIRDELVVSINTVSSHVRSIFSKCGVHSQQELMDLARGAKEKDAPAGAEAGL